MFCFSGFFFCVACAIYFIVLESRAPVTCSSKPHMYALPTYFLDGKLLFGKFASKKYLYELISWESMLKVKLQVVTFHTCGCSVAVLWKATEQYFHVVLFVCAIVW